MACYLVTGGAGFIGSHLVESLIDYGHFVRVLDDLSSGSRDNIPAGVEFIKADITDPKAVGAAFDGIDGCFHLAAIASVEKCNRDWLRTHQVNLTGTINVFNAARQSRKIARCRSSMPRRAAVYGNSGGAPAGEQSSAAPLSAYGADKRACELHARAAGVTHGLRTVGLRFFNIYGPRQDPRSPYSGVIAIFLDRLQRGEPIEIFGDGTQVRDFTYIGDAVSRIAAGDVDGERVGAAVQRLHREGHDRESPRRDDRGFVPDGTRRLSPPGAVRRSAGLHRRPAAGGRRARLCRPDKLGRGTGIDARSVRASAAGRGARSGLIALADRPGLTALV